MTGKDNVGERSLQSLYIKTDHILIMAEKQKDNHYKLSEEPNPRLLGDNKTVITNGWPACIIL